MFKLSTGAWETLSVNDDFHSTKLERNLGQVFMNGDSHWVGHTNRFRGFLEYGEMVILLFHMCDEELRVMKLPNVLASLPPRPYSLVVFDGLLFLMRYNPIRNDPLVDYHLGQQYDGCCIWSMKEYGVIVSWTKQYTIDLRDWEWLGETLSFRNKNEILIVTKSKETFLYDLNTNRFVSLGIRKLYHLLLSS